MMTKKTYIKVVGNPRFSAPKKPNRPVINPLTGTPRFGSFPALKARGKEFASGPIYLREGQHRGPNSGFGLRHIWQEHFADEIDPKRAESKVVAFVAGILRHGSEIYYEGGVDARRHRTLVW
jgi:hypothetical protein